MLMSPRAFGSGASDPQADLVTADWPRGEEGGGGGGGGGQTKHPPAASRQAWTHPRETTHFPAATPIRYLKVRLQRGGQADCLTVAPN